MARRRRTFTEPDALIARIGELLERFRVDYRGLALRDRVRRLAEVLGQMKDLNVGSVRNVGITAASGRARILEYLQLHVGQAIGGGELEVVAGIADYPRRVRELRKEHGYQIISGASADPDYGVELRPDQYVLLDHEPDAQAAQRWKLANAIRRKATSTSARLLEYLKANVNKVVTTEELAYVAKERRDFARRVRELRTEQGYPIATKFTGRPDLKMGQYVLEALEPDRDVHERDIPVEVEKAVYARDNHTCRLCGWNHALWTREDPRHLVLHHVTHHASAGPNTADNLIVICKTCHEDLHAGRKEMPSGFRADVPPAR